VRRLLRVVGILPLVLDQTAFLPTMTNADHHGRVRQGRPGQSISSLQRCPRVRVAKPRITAEWVSSRIEKCQRAREFQ
jgi:hypothetical protein